MARRTYRRKFSLVIAANAAGNANATLDRSGSMFAIKEASAEFDLEFDDNGKESGEGGVRFETGTDTFSKIVIYNRSTTVALVVTGWTGLGSGVPGVFYDYLRERRTILLATNGAFAGAALVSFPGVSPTLAEDAVRYAACLAVGIPPGSRRRQFVVSNRSVNDLYVASSAGVDGDVISPNDARAYSTDDTFKIHGTNANAWFVMELFNV